MGPITRLTIAPTKLCYISSNFPSTPIELVTTITLATTSSRMAAPTMTTSTSSYWGSITLFGTIPPSMSSLPTSITLLESSIGLCENDEVWA